MKPISAATIDQVIEELDNLSDAQYERRMEDFADRQPVLVAYLFHEDNFHLLTEDEKGFMQYLALIVWTAIAKEHSQIGPVTEEQIGEAEEKNYETLENSGAKKFRERLDPFFEKYPQEELLAFVEDAVLEDENDPEALVTREGREPIFVTLKTVIDVLTAENDLND